MEPLTLCIQLFAIFLIFYTLWRFRLSANNGGKAPEAEGGWPLIGHLSLFTGPKLPHEALGALADKYGPIFTIRLGVRRVCVVSSTEVAKKCFNSNDVSLSGRPKLAGRNYMTYDYAMYGFGPYNSYWREVRKLSILNLLTNRRLVQFEQVRANEVEDAIKEMYKLWRNRKDGEDTVSVEMKESFGRLTLNLVLRIVTGKRYSSGLSMAEEEEGRRCRETMREFIRLVGLFVVGDAIPYLGWLDVGGNVKAMKKNAKELDKMATDWLEDHKRKKKNGVIEEEDFMDVMLSVLESSSPAGKFDADTVHKATSMNLIFAANDSTAVVLIWALSLLLNNPNALRKVQTELDQHVSKERLLNESDINKLVYFQAAIKETLRLYSASGLFVRECMENCCITGYKLEKGTWVVFNIWKIHRDPTVWPEPLEYKPERFLTTHKQVEVNSHGLELLPFGAGRRACPGLSFSLQIIHLTLASFLHAFDVSTPGSAAVDMAGTIGLTNMKSSPLHVLIKPRLLSTVYDRVNLQQIL